jgi:hypothetical protein
MEKSNRIAQVYGYLVCLVAVITLLISISNLFNAIIDRNDPLHAEMFFSSGTNISSYETYRLDKLRSYQGTDSLQKAYTPDEKTIREMFDAEKNERVLTVKHRTYRSIIVFSILTGLALVLFFGHWRWLRRMGKAEV